MTGHLRGWTPCPVIKRTCPCPPLHRLSVLALALVGTLAATGLQAASRNWSYTYTAAGQIETADG
ncbi:hypothetical protein, partial [Metapseudomonas otitidis]